MLYALLLGMALNGVAVEGRAKPGVDFAARRILRLGVALLGARITFEQIAASGWAHGLLMIARGRRDHRVRRRGGEGAGRLAPPRRPDGRRHRHLRRLGGDRDRHVLPRDEKSERELIFTIAGVTALSTLAMIVYPVIVKWLGLDARAAGFFLGGTIHDVAQVVGAGYSISPEVGDFAVLTKLLRVAMLLPVVAAIALAVRSRVGKAAEGAAASRCCRRSCSPSSRSSSREASDSSRGRSARRSTKWLVPASSSPSPPSDSRPRRSK